MGLLYLEGTHGRQKNIRKDVMLKHFRTSRFCKNGKSSNAYRSAETGADANQVLKPYCKEWLDSIGYDEKTLLPKGLTKFKDDCKYIEAALKDNFYKRASKCLLES